MLNKQELHHSLAHQWTQQRFMQIRNRVRLTEVFFNGDLLELS